MNPLVEQMLNATVSNDVETRLLEDLFEQEAKCESQAHLIGCTGEVTHLFTSTHKQINVCADTEAYVKDSQDNPRRYCKTCGQSTRLCWTIRPI